MRQQLRVAITQHRSSTIPEAFCGKGYRVATESEGFTTKCSACASFSQSFADGGCAGWRQSIPGSRVRSCQGNPCSSVGCSRCAGTVRIPARPGYAGIPPARVCGLLARMQRSGYAGILPACSGLGTRASCPQGSGLGTRASCPRAAAWVRGHLARMQRPGYAGILPACSGPGTRASCPHAAVRVRGHLARMQRPGYAGILPACSGVTCHGSESIMKIENL